MSKPSIAARYRTARGQGRSWFTAIFTSTWSSLGSWIGTYDAVDPRNKAMRGVIARPSSPAELAVSLPYIRNLCRNYERNNATFRAAVEGLVANVIGTGIALEPDTGDPEADIKIRDAWLDYITDCGVDGSPLYELQQLGFRDEVVAGETLWRLVIDMERMKSGRIPLCVMPLEPEWLGAMDGMTLVASPGATVAGVELDDYGRATSYRLCGPTGKHEDVPARMVIHNYERRRSLQVRGEPWAAPILTTLRQDKDLVTAELESAKVCAAIAIAITSEMNTAGELDEKGDPVENVELGSTYRLLPGEDIKTISHNRPGQQIAAFRGELRGEMAAAMRLGRRWMDRNVGGANYSSLRADQQDSERLLSPVRERVGHHLAGRVYKAVLPYLCAKIGIKVPARTAYRLIADATPYIDPLKDGQAALQNIAGGLSTFEQEIGKRGGDYRAVFEQIGKERELLDAMGIKLVNPSGGIVGQEGEATADTGDMATRDKSGKFA